MKKKSKILIGCLSLLIIGIVATVFITGKGKNKNTVFANGSYEEETLIKRDLANSVSATGTFESNQKISVSSDLVNYKIKTVNVEIGDKVEKGAVICEFDSEDIEKNLEVANRDLETAKKQNSISEKSALRNVNDAKTSRADQYDMATDGIKSAKDNWNDAIKERDNLKKKYEDAKSKAEKYNNTLKSTDKKTNPEGYANAQSSLAEAKASRDNLKTQYDAAATTVKTAKSTYEKAQKERKTADKTNSSNVAGMEDSLKNTQIGNESSLYNLQNQIDTYKKQLKKTVVKAESDGVITSLNVSEGQTYVGGDIAVIENPNDLIISAEIEEYEISDIREDIPVKIKTEATGSDILDGKVTYVASIATSNSGSMDTSSLTSSSSSGVTYEVKVTLNEENERIRLGMSAKMSMITDEVQNVFAVPYEAIQEKETGEKFVYAIGEKKDGEEPTKTEIMIESGLESSYYVEVKGSELEDGMAIYVPIDNTSSSKDDMMNAFGGPGR